MANGRNKSNNRDSGRDPGGFVALPWSVLDCPAYARLSHPARSLLMEIARQFVKDNNGRLLASGAHLLKRGWKSADVITRAKRDLIAAGFIFETVMGHRPNKASWYAVTWQHLDRLKGYDEGTLETFRRGAYAAGVPLQRERNREDHYQKWREPGNKNASLTPSGGVEAAPIAPSGGVERLTVEPSRGAMDPISAPPLYTVSRKPSRDAIYCGQTATYWLWQSHAYHPANSGSGDRVIHGKGKRLRRTGRRGGQLRAQCFQGVRNDPGQGPRP